MKLNSYIIADYLSLNIRKSSLHANISDCTIERIDFYQADRPIMPNAVTIISASELITLKPQCGCFVCIGYLTGELSSSADIIFVDPNYNISDVYYALQDVNHLFYKWESEMNQLIFQETALKELGECTLKFLNNPICLYTASHRNLFACEQYDDAKNSFFTSKDIDTYLPDEDIDAMRVDEEFISTLSCIEPSIFSDAMWGYRILFYNIHVNNIYIARIMSCEIRRPIKLSDHAILKHLGTYIARMLQKTDITLNTHPKDLDRNLIDLLNRKNVQKTELSYILRNMNWNVEHNYFCVVIDINDRDTTVHTVASECARLEDNFKESLALPLEKYILFLVNLSVSDADKTEIISRLVYILREGLLKAGVSMEFTSLMHLVDYYEQACDALTMGKEKNKMIWCHHYKDYILDCMIKRAAGNVRTPSLMLESLKRLIKYDKENNREFTKSLIVYLQNDRNIAESCRLLYLHRATFLYHLKRIREITELNLDDKNIRLYLLIIFAIMEQKGELL